MWQGLVGAQLVPALHATHVPAKHTFPLPHMVPSGWLAMSEQTEIPVAQEVAPTLQGVADWQAWLSLQAVQLPLLQTLSAPQAIPLGTTPPASGQLTDGTQVVFPVWQALVGTQSRPAVQDVHAPPLHTIPAPQSLPFGALPDSTHTGDPVLHAVTPTRHWFLGTVQLAPTTQAPQTPTALQSIPAPQAVPAGALLAPSRHIGAPAVQLNVPR